MAAPATPTNFNIQQGNGQILLTWDLVAGAVSYSINRSVDQVNYTQVATPVVTEYLDTAVSAGVQYFYKIAAIGTAAAFAEAALTFSGQPLAGESVQVANQTFTAVASGATGNQFNIGANVAGTIANLVSKVNSGLPGTVIATATSSTLLSLQAFVIGPSGNGLELVNGLSNVSAVAFSGGAPGAQGSLSGPVSIVPSLTAQMSLSQIRLLAQQRADRVGSNFVTLPEWNVFINQSYYELYDLLVTVYEDYFQAPALALTTDGVSARYALPDGSNYGGIAPLYKLMGVDLGLDASSNAFVTLKKFDFIERNQFLYPSVTSTFLGVFNMRYRMIGNSIEFQPVPQAGQNIRVWYIPKLRQLLRDVDVVDGISGWTEYIVVDAAIKALQKEESDVSALMAEKQALILRINSSAMNRDAGSPDTISNSRRIGSGYGGGNYGWGGDGWGGM